MVFAPLRARLLLALGLPGVVAASALAGCSAEAFAQGVPDASVVRADAGDGAWIVVLPAQSFAPPAAMAAVYPVGDCPAPEQFCIQAPARRPSRRAAAENFDSCPLTVVHPADRAVTPRTAARRGLIVDSLTASERRLQPRACCYEVHAGCPGGRPLRTDGDAVLAAVIARDDWAAQLTGAPALPDDPRLRARLAAHWAREAAAEHASVAAFARAALELLALGAPPELLASTQRAGLDEIAHARFAFALAGAYGGAPCGPGALAVGAPARGFAAVAAATFLDGCVNEAAAAVIAACAAADAQDPVVRAGLTRIARDEAAHAELAWRTLAWLVAAGGAEASARVADAWATVTAPLAAGTEARGALRAFGVLDARTQRLLYARTVVDVVGPCVSALLGGRAPRSAVRTLRGCARRDGSRHNGECMSTD